MMQLCDIFNGTDGGQLRTWLRTLVLPTLVSSACLQRRGFNPAFIRRFNKKHDRVLLLDGTIARGVRGVNELEILQALAEALDVRPFADGWDFHDVATTMKVAQQCLGALDTLEKAQGVVTVQGLEQAGAAMSPTAVEQA